MPRNQPQPHSGQSPPDQVPGPLHSPSSAAEGGAWEWSRPVLLLETLNLSPANRPSTMVLLHTHLLADSPVSCTAGSSDGSTPLVPNLWCWQWVMVVLFGDARGSCSTEQSACRCRAAPNSDMPDSAGLSKKGIKLLWMPMADGVLEEGYTASGLGSSVRIVLHFSSAV